VVREVVLFRFRLVWAQIAGLVDRMCAAKSSPRLEWRRAFHLFEVLGELGGAMIGSERAKAIALAMPEAEEHDHRGHPSFRVRGKILCTLWPAERRAVLKLPLDVQGGLVGGEPKAFSLNAWSCHGWTNVHLQHVSVKQFSVLVVEAWRQVAPKSLVARLNKGA
jgi:hypothetical protein